MTPVRFSVKNGITTFHYSFKDLREWAKRGYEHGDCGLLLFKRQDSILFYGGFGTIEHPQKVYHEFTMIHNPFFDGTMPPDEARLKPPVPPEGFTHSFKIIDLSK